jgi:DNA invertase Pin-like site-specific DNA recombinase
MQAIIYAARSKDEELGKDSTRDQVAAIRKALPKDHKVIGKPHIDHASGFTGNRGPALEAAITTAVAAAPSELWVFHSSRLARGSGERDEARSLMELLVYLRRRNVTVRSVEDDAFVTNRMLWGVAEELAHKYSLDLSAHVRKGRRASFEEGHWGGARRVPDGYTLGPLVEKGPRGLVIDQPRAIVIRRMAELASEGRTYKAVARQLNAEGYRTNEGNPWRGERVHDTLSNPVYAGRVVWHRREPDEEVRDGSHEAIIDPEAFDALGAKIGMRNRGRGKGGGRPAPFTALSGIAVCDACGARMVSRRSPHVRKDGTRQAIYICANRRGGTGTCDAPQVDAAKVDQAIMARLTAWTTDWEAWKDEQVQALDRERAALAAELASREQDHEQRVKARDKMRKRYIDKPSDTTEEALTECRRLVKDAETRVAETQTGLDAYPTGPDTDALLDVHSRFSGIATDPKLTVNSKAKMLLKEVRIFTFPNGEVLLQCVGREDVVIPPLQPGTKPGVGDVPEGYHVIPTREAQQALLATTNRNAWA